MVSDVLLIGFAVCGFFVIGYWIGLAEEVNRNGGTRQLRRDLHAANRTIADQAKSLAVYECLLDDAQRTIKDLVTDRPASTRRDLLGGQGITVEEISYDGGGLPYGGGGGHAGVSSLRVVK